MQCIYGVSRKHGKPGRTRKRNPDGTPFIKNSKQRPTPDGSEFGKFRIRSEPVLQPALDYTDATSNWSSNWSSTPSLPGTPDFTFELTPEPYMDTPDLTFMDDDSLLPASQLEQEVMQPMESELTFRDPFAKRQSAQIDVACDPNVTGFVGHDSVSYMNYQSQQVHSSPYLTYSEPTLPQMTKDDRVDSYDPILVSMSMPTSHCCYTLAYSTLGSLSIIGGDAATAYSEVEGKSLDNLLSITRLAIQSVQQLLHCSCSSDPHLAMLYSSITSKLLTWYRVAAGVNSTTALAGPSSSHSAPISTAYLSRQQFESRKAYSLSYRPLHFNAYHSEFAEQQRLTKQAVRSELQYCGQLVDALANWTADGASEQIRFLYDVLGTWLKSEMYNTIREVDGAHTI
jgi:hypothetical protein